MGSDYMEISYIDLETLRENDYEMREKIIRQSTLIKQMAEVIELYRNDHVYNNAAANFFETNELYKEMVRDE